MKKSNAKRTPKAASTKDAGKFLDAEIFHGTGSATYLNKANGDTYELGFCLNEGDTVLSRAWDLAEFAARTNGWRVSDVFVQVKKRK